MQCFIAQNNKTEKFVTCYIKLQKYYNKYFQYSELHLDISQQTKHKPGRPVNVLHCFSERNSPKFEEKQDYS